MSHKSGDAMYWTHYRNEPSTRGVEAENVEILSSASLTRPANAPKYMSKEGARKVFQDPEFIRLIDDQDRLLDPLIQR